ncbi:biotin transporter BioY [Anoxybacillus sp. LAT_35]|uniref:biotin transporter BioY n=1 Tax=unclassified Anoxybacillus TaxID=2639704 RepID=UPI001EDC15E6|nr:MULTISPECIES: biotin transporter BioY [unclassified Anoxybacillus]MCG5026713.1 biotin transporter BioY [Anoxybacillus flavithermus]MCG6196976.1 biotin transporter BioY [Anoxybacillus sp. LAT_38]MCG3083281.1 biotin transporter BioY [Anoxybacillus sp. LAT27]MCG3084503.1 biotin transporter BioY [Anoxybacillus sp. LAT27]MCG6171294.1 biotin transporter BioY [Anoxybacillus sp. LAT_11]
MRAKDLTFIAMFAALMAIGANITSWAPFLVIGGVPITLQTFFCVLAGAILGAKRGAMAMTVYMLIGLFGAPVFARFSGGFSTVIAPTFGFILSFILAAYVTGLLIEKSTNRSIARFITATIIGMVINYVVGTNWMYAAFKLWAEAPEGFSYAMAWSWMLVPLPKDIILSIVAGIIAPRIYKALNQHQSYNKYVA